MGEHRVTRENYQHQHLLDPTRSLPYFFGVVCFFCDAFFGPDHEHEYYAHLAGCHRITIERDAHLLAVEREEFERELQSLSRMPEKALG